MLYSLGWKHPPCSEQIVPSKTDIPLNGHQQSARKNAVFKTAKVRNKTAASCNRKGPALRYPALICGKLNWDQGFGQTPEEATAAAVGAAGCAAVAVRLLHLDQQASQFSNCISPNRELRRTARFHSLDNSKVPEAEGCSLRSSNEWPETVLKRDTRTVLTARWQIQKSKYVCYVSSGLLEKCISCGFWRSLDKIGNLLTTQL